MYPPLWLRLLRLYGQHFPILRGKSRVTRWAFSRLSKLDKPIYAAINGDIRIELWPWLWADFCTYVMGSPEPYHLAYFTSLISNQSVIFDVGAYIGVYALAAARIARAGRVHAFEPDPRSAHRLNQAIESNGLRNLRLYPYAVGNRAGKQQMILPDYPPMSSLQPVVAFSKGEAYQVDAITVPVCTLDEHCRATGIQHVDLLKIDVEGAEMLILQGASGLIEACQPEMLIELHQTRSRFFGYSAEEVIDHLHALGYRLFHILPGVRRPHLIPFDLDVLAHTGRQIVIARPTWGKG